MADERYLLVRNFVELRFSDCRRRVKTAGVEADRLEMWDDLLSAALGADRKLAGPAGGEKWEAALDQAVETAMLRILPG